MSNNHVTINEITELLSNPDNIQKDMTEALELMKNHLHKKYINKMMDTVENYQNNAKKNPSAEVMLLNAWKPFVPAEAHERINGIIDMFHTINTLNNMREGVETFWAETSQYRVEAATAEAPIKAAEANSSVHPDGVYDIDEQCYVNYYGNRHSSGFDNVAGMMMLFTFMNMS